MRKINKDSFPHLINCSNNLILKAWYTLWVKIEAKWWGIDLGSNCSFMGYARFRRFPNSSIHIGEFCDFRSLACSNLIGINRPCMISTLKENARVFIGANCGFSGTTIGCASEIILDEYVRCGANTTITDTDWHMTDRRSMGSNPIRIDRGVWLGMNVSVLKGVNIGENTIVAAGSVVTRSLPSNIVAAGIPAKIVKRIE